MRFEAVDAPIGARVVGFDPGARITAADVTALLAGLTHHSVLIFRGQEIAADQFVALGRAFGQLEILPEPEKRHPDHPEIFNLSNVRPDGELVVYDDPSLCSCGAPSGGTPTARSGDPLPVHDALRGGGPPSGGETQFADMYSAWESLDEGERAVLDGQRLVHDYVWSRANNPGEMDEMDDAEKAKYPSVIHPLVRTHSDGRRSLYMGGACVAHRRSGTDASRSHIDAMTERATQPRFVYEHRWAGQRPRGLGQSVHVAPASALRHCP